MLSPSKHTVSSAGHCQATAPLVSATRRVRCSSFSWPQLKNAQLPIRAASATKRVTPLSRKALSPMDSSGTAL